jgi:hypothetical protein
MPPIFRLSSSAARAPSAVVARDGRLPALDRLRGALVGLVVLHHAVLAYCTFGRIDRAEGGIVFAVALPASWAGAWALRRSPLIRNVL